jgi:ATP-binding cassette subfamily B protein
MTSQSTTRHNPQIAGEGTAPAAPGRPAIAPLRALVPYFLRYRGRVLAALAALTLAALATLAVPLAVRRMIDVGFSASDAAFVDQTFLALIAVAATLALASASRYYLVITLGERIVADLRNDLFSHIMVLSPAFFDKARSGEILSRLTADTTQIKSAVGASASIALRNLVMFTGATVMMVITSPGLSSLVLVVIPFIVLPIVAFGRKVRRQSRFAQDTLADASAYAGEVISQIRTVQALTYEAIADRLFGTRVEEAFSAARRATAARALLTGFAIFFVFSSVVGILWWGAQSVLAGEMSAGRLGQFVLYSVFAAGALGELSQVWGEISQAAGATERIVELLHTPADITAPADPLPMSEPARGEIRFENVSFAYRDITSDDENRPVLEDLSLTIAPGERVAIVGPSGAGKSTLFALLMRFYDPREGRILVDGVDIRKVAPADLRARMALVPQDIAMFAAPVADNIRLGRWDADSAAVSAAAQAARADGFIADLPQAYATMIGERGITLSGGQRQRIAIARAILRDAPVLLLDEATSALDAESEKLVQLALEDLMRGRTSLVIAHRLATVRSADRIIVMDKGRIAEQGRHDDLVAQNGLYARLARLQFDDNRQIRPAAE